MDELEQRIARAAAELQAALGERTGRISFDFTYPEEMTVAGDRIGFARLALEALSVAAPATITSADDLPGGDDRLLDSPIVGYRRDDAPPAETRMSWKDRLIAAGCLLSGAVAAIAVIRGLVALERDFERLLQ